MYAADEIIALMGDRVDDAELGYPDGTLERAAERIIESGIDPDDLDDDAWQALILATLEELRK